MSDDKASISAGGAFTFPVDDRATTAPNPMCERKTNDIMQREGYEKTGYVLKKVGSQICVSDGGAVAWFTPEQWQWLMFNRDHVPFQWPAPISQPSPSTGGALPPPKYPQMRMLAEGDISECCGYTAEQMRDYRAGGEPATDSAALVSEIRKELSLAGTTTAGRLILLLDRAADALAAREPAPVARVLPTNDEVFAEVQRLRGTLNHYVSTNAVNDTMQAVRSLMVGPAVAHVLDVEAERLSPIEEKLDAAWKWIADAPHGENCFLHDEGEFDKCFCGKDALLTFIESEDARTAAPAAPPEQPKWISVEERTPDDCAFVMIHVPDNETTVWISQWLAGSKTFESNEMGWLAKDEVSHWMPIPAAPKVDSPVGADKEPT